MPHDSKGLTPADTSKDAFAAASPPIAGGSKHPEDDEFDEAWGTGRASKCRVVHLAKLLPRLKLDTLQNICVDLGATASGDKDELMRRIGDRL